MSKHNRQLFAVVLLQIGMVIVFPALLFTACAGGNPHQTANHSGQTESDNSHREVATPVLSDAADGVINKDVSDATPQQPSATSKSATALRFDSLGLVNIADLDSSIAVSLLYATPDNFVGEIMYDDLTEAYLHPEAAEALLKAQRLLKESHPDFTLIIYDATRPMSAQRKMWDLVKGTPKNIYVSNPSRGGGLHNYGLAVDISILGADGTPLDMGTEVDHLGIEAHTTNEAGLVKKGIITQQAKENRELLRKVMRGAGFRALHSEWWHFNLHSREVAKKNYKLVE